MRKMLIYTAASLFYMEMIYHLGSFALTGMSLLLLVPAVLVLAAVETGCIGLFRCRQQVEEDSPVSERKVNGNLVLFWIIQGVQYLLFSSQLVYFHIFKKALLFSAVVNIGGAALTSFWKETLNAVFQCSGYLLAMAVPMMAGAYLLRKKKLTLYPYDVRTYKEIAGYFMIGVAASVISLAGGYFRENGFYEEYQGMYAPETIVKRHGVLSLTGRQMLGNLLPEQKTAVLVRAEETEQKEAETTEEPAVTEEIPDYDVSPHVLDIDMQALSDQGKDIAELASFMESVTPTNKNEYTGMFEGYNLIYLTAEGFAPYAVSEELTPTLYQMMNSGVVVKDYYVPLWQTSTSDGEYVNLTGQIPDGQFSMKRTKENAQPYSLPAYFAAEGAKSFAYHNNSLSYYDRYLTHTNLGYDFKASKSGSLSEKKWESQLFSIESSANWPSSDYEMIEATLPEYIQEPRFHVYYMTVSGHMEYNFKGNAMSAANKAVVEDLECAESMKAYIACNYELERAMAYLVEELEKAGKLDRTVIVISADHYPYGLETGVIEEYTGQKLEDSLDLYKNCLILWNSQMETIEVGKTCSALDIIPTLYNLFGFAYDSRLFPGRDMLSDSESLVIFSDRSFITDTVIYNQSTGKVQYRTDEGADEEYVEEMKAYVRALTQYSAGILNQNYFQYVADSLS
ncbi:MAG: LTA synthase family protein [Lachnospiraceae bacterium]|jgi:lipoteichoic acid synthase